MEVCLITFRSITPAQRGEVALRNYKVPCTLKRTPTWLQEKGCGYSLRVSKDRVLEAMSILQSQQISYQKVYSQLENGKVEEVRF